MPGFSVHGISQAKILEWAAISFSKGVCNLRVFLDDARCQCPFVLCFHPQAFLRKGVRASRSYQE